LDEQRQAEAVAAVVVHRERFRFAGYRCAGYGHGGLGWFGPGRV
jgi:hypothetical protein